MYRPLTIAALSLALALPLTSLSAQATPDSVKLRNDCRLAMQVIRTGQPAPKTQWAWNTIASCPEAGTAAAAGLRRLREDPDTAHFAPVTRVGFAVLDGELFAAALEVAGDRNATPAAREASFIVLVNQLTRDWDVDFHTLSRMDLESGCRLGLISDRGVSARLMPLPGDAAARAGAVASAVSANAAEPIPVRVAADCITRAIRDQLLRQP